MFIYVFIVKMSVVVFIIFIVSEVFFGRIFARLYALISV